MSFCPCATISLCGGGPRHAGLAIDEEAIMQIDRMPGFPTMEFHVARDSRDRYRFDEALYTLTGNVVFANFHGARVFAQRMNQKRDLANFPEQADKPSQINALALIHELTHYMFRAYREQQN